LCEKPLEVTPERARRLVSACRDADVPLMVGYRMQTDPAVRRLRDLLDASATAATSPPGCSTPSPAPVSKPGRIRPGSAAARRSSRTERRRAAAEPTTRVATSDGAGRQTPASDRVPISGGAGRKPYMMRENIRLDESKNWM
ncbi:hypothetical protein DJ72_11860, partial [Halorubrum distributum]